MIISGPYRPAWSFNASIAEGIPQKLEHNDIRRITVEESGKYQFCPADEPIVKNCVNRILTIDALRGIAGKRQP